jgi:hypothetical protein
MTPRRKERILLRLCVAFAPCLENSSREDKEGRKDAKNEGVGFDSCFAPLRAFASLRSSPSDGLEATDVTFARHFHRFGASPPHDRLRFFPGGMSIATSMKGTV